MFETLNNETLIELAKVGDRTLFKDSTSIDTLTACLDQAATECQTAGRSTAGAPFDTQQVIGGLQAAQQILTSWWASGHSS